MSVDRSHKAAKGGDTPAQKKKKKRLDHKMLLHHYAVEAGLLNLENLSHSEMATWVAVFDAGDWKGETFATAEHFKKRLGFGRSDVAARPITSATKKGWLQTIHPGGGKRADGTGIPPIRRATFPIAAFSHMQWANTSASGRNGRGVTPTRPAGVMQLTKGLPPRVVRVTPTGAESYTHSNEELHPLEAGVTPTQVVGQSEPLSEPLTKPLTETPNPLPQKRHGARVEGVFLKGRNCGEEVLSDEVMSIGLQFMYALSFAVKRELHRAPIRFQVSPKLPEIVCFHSGIARTPSTKEQIRKLLVRYPLIDVAKCISESNFSWERKRVSSDEDRLMAAEHLLKNLYPYSGHWAAAMDRIFLLEMAVNRAFDDATARRLRDQLRPAHVLKLLPRMGATMGLEGAIEAIMKQHPTSLDEMFICAYEQHIGEIPKCPTKEAKATSSSSRPASVEPQLVAVSSRRQKELDAFQNQLRGRK